MKYFLLASAILLGTLNAFSQEATESVKCVVTQHHVTDDLHAGFAEMDANEITITITRQELIEFKSFQIPIGEYEGVRLALSMIAYPNSHYSGAIFLSRYTGDVKNIGDPILATHTDDVRTATLAYRSPQNNLRVRITCQSGSEK